MPATRAHAKYIGLRLREQDMIELSFTQPGVDPVDVTESSWENSDPLAFTAIWNGKPILMFGCAATPKSEHIGMPWLLGTDGIFERGASAYLLKFSPHWVVWMNDQFPYLTNMTHANNTVSRRWLEFCGFEFEPMEHLVHGGEFVRFWRTPSCVSLQPSP